MYASSYFEQDDGANLRFFFITAKKKKIFFLCVIRKKGVSICEVNPESFLSNFRGSLHEEEIQVDKYVRDMIPKAELGFNPIGI